MGYRPSYVVDPASRPTQPRVNHTPPAMATARKYLLADGVDEVDMAQLHDSQFPG